MADQKLPTENLTMSSDTTASKFMSIIGDDLLHEILTRIRDYDTAIQCRSVCKRWSSLISHPQYLRTAIHHHRRRLLENNSFHHRRRNKSFEDQFYYKTLPYRLMYSNFDGEVSYQIYSDESNTLHTSSNPSIKTLDFFPWRDGVIRASFRDLLLVSRGLRSYCICNPLTRKWHALPEAPVSRSVKCYALVCNPNNNRYSYKVVLIKRGFSHNYHPQTDNVTTFCSETGQWSESILNLTLDRVLAVVTTREGLLHWLTLRYSTRNFGNQLPGIGKFDPFKTRDDPAQCHYIYWPDGFGSLPSRGEEMLHLQAVQGRLRLSRLDNDGFLGLRVWELCYGYAPPSWILVHDLVLERGTEARGSSVAVVAFDPNDGDVIFLLRGCDLYRCNAKKGGFRRSKVGNGEFWEKRVGVEEKVGNGFPHGYGRLHLSLFTLVHPQWPSPVTGLPSN